MDNYWDRTDRMIGEGRVPTCSYCGEQMFPEDDHGRFACFCAGYQRANKPLFKIPQVTKEMPDEEKAKIPAINRLHLTPTREDQKHIEKMFGRMREDAKEMGLLEDQLDSEE